MAKKQTEVVIKQGVKWKGTYPTIGSKIKMDHDEAARLITLGAVALPQPQLEEQSASKPITGNGQDKQMAAEAALIEKIKAAKSLSELDELAPDNPGQAVIDAAQVRAEELEKAQK